MPGDIIKKHFKQSQFNTKLNNLWKYLLNTIFSSQTGPYPADHGKDHIANALHRLDDLLLPYEKSTPGKSSPFKHLFTIERKAELFASVMIHDVGMVKVLPQGAYSPKSKESREQHSRLEIIREFAESYLLASGFDTDSVDRIITIAAAHAGDDLHSPYQKLKAIDALVVNTGNNHMPPSVALVRFADFLDIGKQRLNTNAQKINWSEPQVAHLQKHLLLKRPQIDTKNRVVTFDLTDTAPDISKQIPAIKQLSILREVHEDAAEAIAQLNKVMSFTEVRWSLAQLDEAKYGQIWPLSSGASLFRRQFQKALFTRKENDTKPFPMDWMGHSLYQRFIENSEGLNKDFKDRLSGNIVMRVLLLDPSVENQQMCEVYEAQRIYEHERSILPLYDEKGKIVPTQKSDIQKSLDEIADWAKLVKGSSSLEVRVTTRLMYMSLTRFDKRIIITPYKGGGLFNESFAIVLTEDSPLYKACAAEFDSIWDSAIETRLEVHAYGDPNTSINPISRLLHKTNFNSGIPPFDYERFVLGGYKDRIKALFEALDDDKKIFPPPFEVEIQPSEKCELNCHYCIGKHLRHRDSSSNIVNYKLDSLLEYQQKNWKIDRFRISGLFGDPLEKSSKDIALDFLRKAKEADRKVVLFTNGLELADGKVREALNAVNYVHISLDAATKETYSSIKRVDKKVFDMVTSNVRTLCRELNDSGHKAVSVGVGFVVTQGNVHEVDGAIKLARKLGVSFIRFKPDLRGMNAISWRAWREFSQSIKTNRDKNTDISINLTNIVWYHYNVPVTERCWAQYLCTTIGADGNVYPCDHLTGNGVEGALGKIGEKSFQEIWENAPRRSQDARYRECVICPPFGWSINKLLEELHVLYKKYGWDRVESWIDDALQNKLAPIGKKIN